MKRGSCGGVAKVAATLRGMLHTVGVRAEQFAVMDQWTTGMLDLLEQHFARHSYLFGERPTIGDFGLVGTMYGHLGRDPWPARELIAPRPCLRAWIARMAKAPIQTHAELLTDDAIADTLSPVFRAIFAEFIPLLDGINQQVKAALPALPPADVCGRTAKRARLVDTTWRCVPACLKCSAP